MSLWTDKLREFQCDKLFDASGTQSPFDDMQWKPSAADKSAAWELYTEMRTRITTQPLAYRHGDEETALTSVFNIFDLTRKAIAKHEGCTHFATLAVHVLNVHIRPFTANWHKVKVAGHLDSRDTCHRFRRELRGLQEKLRHYMRLLGYLAEGDDFKPGTESGIASTVIYTQYDLGKSIPFGVTGSLIPVSNAVAIDEAERVEVLARRKTYGLSDKPEDAVGLAISGGGIRSATFALGVVQYLARKGIMKEVDFVSTVSGGGYLGSFMSSYLNDPKNDKAGLDPARHEWPFGKEGEVESKAVRHLRNHSKYLAEEGIKGTAVVLGQMFYGIAVNLLLTLPFILLVVLVAIYTPGEFGSAATSLVTGLLLASAIALPLLQNLGRNAGADHPKLRTFSSFFERWWCVGLFVALLGLLIGAALPQVYCWMVCGSVDGGSGSSSGLTVEDRRELLAACAAALPALAGILQFLGKKRPLVLKIVKALLTIAGPLIFLAAYFLLADFFIGQHGDLKVLSWTLGREEALWLLFVATALYGGFLVNINYTSPHRYYRRQLSRTYLRRSRNGTEETDHLDTQPLSGMNGGDDAAGTKAPYHFINCALNIPACTDPNLRGRNTDFFVFSKHFCGSPIIGYADTREWEAIDGHLDLGTAMTISAAAASPQLGTIKDASGLSYLLAMLNIRLNYWVARPRKPSSPHELRGPRGLLRMAAPGALYMFKEITGMLMHERSNFLNLSDGGHIENMAIYELLRRRCKFIIALDGEGDSERTFGGLLTMVRLAKIDLGVTIDPDLQELRNDERGSNRSHYLLCRIDYGQGQHGLLLYIKPSMTLNESEFLRKYRDQHPTFPHESTAQQLYDETQFEAYRALGEHIGEDLFRTELVDPIQPGGQPLPPQPGVRAWFQGLANSLLA